jgi:hypothetical protein
MSDTKHRARDQFFSLTLEQQKEALDYLIAFGWSDDIGHDLELASTHATDQTI